MINKIRTKKILKRSEKKILQKIQKFYFFFKRILTKSKKSQKDTMKFVKREQIWVIAKL